MLYDIETNESYYRALTLDKALPDLYDKLVWNSVSFMLVMTFGKLLECVS